MAGGADKKIHIMDVSTAQQQVVGSHDAPVRGVRFADVVGTTGQMVVSGSWDRTIKFWDIRQRPGNAAATLSFDERVYSLDVKKNLVVVATADLNIHLGNLGKPDAPFKTVKSPLKHQTKTVTAFPNGKGWATTSIEGRCGVNAVDEEEARFVMSSLLDIPSTHVYAHVNVITLSGGGETTTSCYLYIIIYLLLHSQTYRTGA